MGQQPPRKQGYHAVLELGFDSWEEALEFRDWLLERARIPPLFRRPVDLTDYPDNLQEVFGR